MWRAGPQHAQGTSFLIQRLALSVENQSKWESQPRGTLEKEPSRQREQHMRGPEQELLPHVQGSTRVESVREGIGDEVLQQARASGEPFQHSVRTWLSLCGVWKQLECSRRKGSRI